MEYENFNTIINVTVFLQLNICLLLLVEKIYKRSGNYSNTTLHQEIRKPPGIR